MKLHIMKYRNYAQELEGAEGEQNALLARIQQQEDSLNQLLVQAKEEEIAAREAEPQLAAAAQQASSKTRLRVRGQALRHSSGSGASQPSHSTESGSTENDSVLLREHIWGDLS